MRYDGDAFTGSRIPFRFAESKKRTLLKREALKHTEANLIEPLAGNERGPGSFSYDCCRLRCTSECAMIDALQSKLRTSRCDCPSLGNTIIIQRNVACTLHAALNVPVSEAMANEEYNHSHL